MVAEEVRYIYKKGARGMQGKNGGKTLLRVPVGTLVYEIKIDQ